MLDGWPHFEALSISNYISLSERIPLARCIGDTAEIALGSAAAAIALAFPAAYFVSRARVRLSNQVYTLSLTLWLVPPIALSLEVYFWFLRLHLYDTKLGLILLYGTLYTTLVIIILAPYMDAIPKRFDELGWMDGLTGGRVLGSVLGPLLRSLLLGLFAVVFIRSWNELLFSTILTNSRVQTVAISMLSLTTGSHLEWGQIAALGTLSLLPVPTALLALELWYAARQRWSRVKRT